METEETHKLHGTRFGDGGKAEQDGEGSQQSSVLTAKASDTSQESAVRQPGRLHKELRGWTRERERQLGEDSSLEKSKRKRR